MTYEEAVKRREERELEQAKLMCSLENKEACKLSLTLISSRYRLLTSLCTI